MQICALRRSKDENTVIYVIVESRLALIYDIKTLFAGGRCQVVTIEL